MEADQLRKLLDPYDLPTLECDGFARVAHWLLKQADIEHEIYFGYAIVTYPDDAEGDSDLVNPHWWIECEGWTIDYKLGMWTTPEAKAPHGVFKVPRHVRYVGEPCELNVTQTIFEILTR